MMQDSSENPVGAPNGNTSPSQQRDVQCRTAENPVAGHKYPSSRRNMYKRRSLPRESIRILEQWLIDHCLNPFPTEEEKKRLAALTNLTDVQVSNWFINARRRQLRFILEKRGVSIDEVLRKKTSKVKRKLQEDKKSNFLNGRLLHKFNITNENSRADRKDPGKGYAMADRKDPEKSYAMPFDSSWCLGTESCFCQECVDKYVNKLLGCVSAKNEFFEYSFRNLLMLTYCGDNILRLVVETRQNSSDSSPSGSE